LQDLEPFTEEVKNDLVNQAREKRFQKRHAKGLEEALVEICKAYDELPNSSETAKSSETGNGLLPERTLDLIEKPTEHLIKPPDDGGTQKMEQMEGDSSMDNLNTLGHISGTDGDVKDDGHDRKDPFLTASKRKISVEKDSDHPKKKKPVASKSASDLHLEQEHFLPTSPFSKRETEDQKVEKESHPTEDFILDPTVEIVFALEVPKECKTKKQLKDADRKENKHVDVTGVSMRTAPEALPVTVPNNIADKESRGFKKLKTITKTSGTDKSERRDHNNKVILDKPNKQLTGKSPAAVFSPNKKSLPASGQRKSEGSADMRPTKRPKLIDRANETGKTGAQSEPKLPVDNKKDISVKNEKSTSVGTGNNTFPETVTTDGKTRKSGEILSPLPRLHSEGLEQPPGSATKLSVIDSAKKGSSIKENGSRAARPLVKPRRRACRFPDDEEEEQRTPPHKTVAKSSSTHVAPTEKIHQTGIRGIPSSQVSNVSAKKSGVAREEKPKSVGRSPVKHEPIYSPTQNKVLGQGRKSTTTSVNAFAELGNKIHPADLKSSGQSRIPASSEVKKPQGSSSKVLYQTSGNSHAQSHAALEKNVLLSKSENAKAKGKPSTQTPMAVENRLSATLSGERNVKLDHSKDDRSNFVDKADFADPSAESVKSMKHLIAAAQARRNLLASGQGNSDGSLADNAVLASTPYGLPGLSPSPSFHIRSASKSAIPEGDIMQFQDSICEPSQRVDLKKPAETDREHEKSPKPKQSSGSLSGGTDAAIARDTLEGMIETLSRTKDSIGRATRHAIECSKHGIADEIVELLIRKMESEPNFHRRIDLLFLLDSITQCSHSQKGVAGASYIRSVQAALPRILSAAAPPVTGAREN